VSGHAFEDDLERSRPNDRADDPDPDPCSLERWPLLDMQLEVSSERPPAAACIGEMRLFQARAC
jgi:hypothetical protein